MSDQTESAPTPKKSKKISQTDIPRVDLNQALRIAQAIVDYGKEPTKPLDIAAALDYTPTSGKFRDLCGAAIGYGLTEGGPNAPLIALKPLALQILSPTEEGQKLAGQRTAVLTPTVERTFLERYDGSALPSETIAHNVLESMGVPAGRTEEAHRLILTNAESVGFLKPIKDKTYVDLASNSAPGSTVTIDPDPSTSGEQAEVGRSEKPEVDAVPHPRSTTDVEARAQPRGIFIGHGKKKGPLASIKTMLDTFKVPYQVAVSEPNLGRPIPEKVRNTIEACGSAILIFTKDELLFDKEGAEVWRPSQNVVHELGAASFQYGDRIVIFKEAGLDLPSNFSSVGYIEFDDGAIESKSMDLLKELVGFGILQVQPAA